MTRVDPPVMKAALGTFALQLQARRGWDTPDVLMFVQDNGEDLTLGILDRPLPPNVEPSFFVTRLAEIARTRSIAVETFGNLVPNLYGLGLICTGEMTPDLDPEDWKGKEKPCDWHGDPSLRPCRLISVIDLYGQVFHVRHELGSAPEVVQDGDLTDYQIVGTPTEGLRQLLIEILKTMPHRRERTEAIERLGKLIVPSIEDALATAKLRRETWGRS